MEYTYKALGPNDIETLRELSTVFTKAFEDEKTYLGHKPSDYYLQKLLAQENFIAVVAMQEREVVGGIVAYELRKFEQERSEICLYDLAVASDHRRHGVATGLMDTLKKIAKARGAYVIYVQADKGDDEAIAYYLSINDKQEDVFHFDIQV